jgi:hypothetical protein
MGKCVGALVGGLYGRPIAYGGSLAGVDMPAVFYVGAGATIFHRVTAGGLPTKLANYPGGTVVTIAMNPKNYKQVYVSDLNNKVWGSSDEGAPWSDMTFNLASLTSLVTTIEVFSRRHARKHGGDRRRFWLISSGRNGHNVDAAYRPRRQRPARAGARPPL